jgi:nitrite transporter NirC
MAMFLPHGAEISLAGFVHNQIFVTLGNLVGGGVFVGLVYWLATPSLRMEAGASLQEEEVIVVENNLESSR